MPIHSLSNRLADETSPYLLQHANDPVAWQPWDDTALRIAREQNKPILLSIGYSACHWCHVMAHESFQDEQTAQLMNELYINIKVDREERPDLDKIYQTAQLIINQRSGGWPLTMFLTPSDQTPFFGGTYFPKDARYGLPSFQHLLQRVSEYYQTQQNDLQTYRQGIHHALAQVFSAATAEPMQAAAYSNQVYRALEKMFDPQHGGFGNEPKFPNCHFTEFLLKYAAREIRATAEQKRAIYMVLFTLEQIGRGGIYDQVGGGFYRYTVDERWHIPHFEKMLYDNASLLGLMAQATTLSDEQIYLDCANETAEWVCNEMQSQQGGYYSALDADSEGEEGKYYVWTQQQVQTLCKQDYSVFAMRFGLDDPPNFEGKWHLWQKHTVAEVAERLSLTTDDVRLAICRGKQALLADRSTRKRPLRDEKMLTAWNALVIKNMARAARLLRKPQYLSSAQSALAFIHQNAWDGKHLLCSFKDGQTKPQSYLDDYAFLIDALLEVCQTEWNTNHFAFACQLADTIIDQFEDTQNGGFFFTPHQHENLIQRPRALADEATPSGYGIATQTLITLGHLLGNDTYLNSAQRAIDQATHSITQSSINHCQILSAALAYQSPPEVLIIRADKNISAEWLDETVQHYDPLRICFAIPAEEELPWQGLADKLPRGDACAYLCRGTSCQAPFDTRDALRQYLSANGIDTNR